MSYINFFLAKRFNISNLLLKQFIRNIIAVIFMNRKINELIKIVSFDFSWSEHINEKICHVEHSNKMRIDRFSSIMVIYYALLTK